MDILKLVIFAVKSYSTGVMDLLKDPIVWLLILIMYFQYKKVFPIQKIMYGKKPKYSMGELITSSMLFGLIGGLIGSIIITLMGITFYKLSGLMFVITASLILMLIKPRYLCLSYSGGLISLFVLIVSDLADSGIIDRTSIVIQFIYNNLRLDVTALMTIIAVLDLVEAVLIWLDGWRCALPVFIKKKEGVAGAFILKRFWIIPAIVFIAGSRGILPFTSSWPMIKPSIHGNIIRNILFVIVPFIAMFGYNDIAISTDARDKARRYSGGLFVFSAVLLLLSIISREYYIFKYIAAIFTPLGHEILAFVEINREVKEKPLWQYREDGIIILDTIPDTPSETMGIMPGETIISINNIRIKSMEDAENVLKSYPAFVWIELMNNTGKIRTVEHKDYVNRVRSLGIITVPRDDQSLPLVREDKGLIKKFISNKK